MIKIALKHWIYDYCIDLIFKGISSNFNKTSIQFKRGDKFSLVECWCNDKSRIIFHNVIINNIINEGVNRCIYLHFKSTSYCEPEKNEFVDIYSWDFVTAGNTWIKRKNIIRFER
jgi:hypothetical protein